MSRNSKEIHTAREGSFRFGEFDLYPSERQLFRGRQEIPLPPKTFDAMLLFVRNAERLVRREELIEALWPDTHVTDANLTNVIVALRKVFGREAIRTVSKFGYRFCLPVLGEPGVHQATYATFLQAKELANLRSLDSMARARDLFALCVAEDPAFATAWAWLGRCSRFLDKFKGGSAVNLDLAQAALRRALAIDPHLACAHHFYTQLQIDLGQSRGAAVRLLQRLVARGDEPESFAGLVQALRFCGQLEESAAAHQRAVALDPAIATSVPHTHFLRGDYQATLDTYGATRYYLDAAAWAALGDATRAATLLRERLTTGQLSPLMGGLMTSLLAVLEERGDAAASIMRALPLEREPEVVFYLARHYALLADADEVVRLLQRARAEGLTASRTLERDSAFARLRANPHFRKELEECRHVEDSARKELDRAAGGSLKSFVGGAAHA
jgi:DNA-binding winged helix-turn-helix (wHTH) protein/tetratricopeptide (TPR) repeat protein